MVKKILLLAISGIVLSGCSPRKQTAHLDLIIEKKIDSLMELMTLEEKMGQLNQLSGMGELTGPSIATSDHAQLIRQGLLGSMLNVNGAKATRQLQEIAVNESRLKIPLLFGYDVIHGYKTIFPIPLGEAASFDLEAIEQAARIAATEATAAGQHWAFAPMVDIARDPRWGRVMEGAGEDPYYGSLVAKARVRGFQGKNLADKNTLAACAKHFVAYGAAMAGRDYNTVDISDRTLHEVYLPPFKAAVDAGVATFMVAFNELNGTPMSAHRDLNVDLLKNTWGFGGFMVSDWGSVGEMITHGYCATPEEAALAGFKAGVDMDMESRLYVNHLKNLVEKGLVSEKEINDAVRRILRIKYRLGLFDDPFRYCDTAYEKEMLLNPRHLDFARISACKSMVLLKNQGILPLSREMRSLALIGPMADNQQDMLGTWQGQGEARHVVTLLNGIKEKLPNTRILYAKGCDFTSNDRSGFAEAMNAARNADAIIVAAGESAMMSGEALCRTNLDLPGVQKDLIRELNKLGKPLVVVLFNGRPLTIEWLDQEIPAILEAWLPGTMGGPAVADILFGDYNPSGKLPMTFPRNVGQIPLFYSHKNTGRPTNDAVRYTSRYIDSPSTPLYPFGYGLSYTTFDISAPELSATSIGQNDSLVVSVNVKNTGARKGSELVQMYVQDKFGSVTRPVRELKGFKRVELEPGQETVVKFTLHVSDLAFYTADMTFKAEPGDFVVYVGSDSNTQLQAGFSLKP